MSNLFDGNAAQSFVELFLTFADLTERFQMVSQQKLRTAINLRDAALALLQKHGEIVPGPYARLVADFKEFHMHRWSPCPGTYGVDIWTPAKKVLNIIWNDRREFLLISFRRGEWENRFLELAGKLSKAKVGTLH